MVERGDGDGRDPSVDPTVDGVDGSPDPAQTGTGTEPTTADDDSIAPVDPAPHDDPTTADPGSGTGGDDSEDGGSRSVVVASLKSALTSDSWLLKSYAVVGTLAAALVALTVVLAFPVWVENTVGASPTVTFSRAFLLISGVVVVAALLAPMLFAERRRRAGERSRRGEFLLGASGYLLVGSLYLSLLISAPPGQRETPPAAVAPVVEFLYGLDATFAPVPPLLAVALVILVGRR